MTTHSVIHSGLIPLAMLQILTMAVGLPGSAIADEAGPGKQVAQVYEFKDEDDKKQELAYWLYLPKSYKGENKLPLVMFLHGSGERGDNLDAVKKWGPPKHVAEGKAMDFILVSPQCPSGQRWDADVLAGLVRQLQQKWSVDQDRTYITGLSMGGYGTWNLLAKHADLFAAAIPVCGGGNPEQAKEMVNVPIWVFHGAIDDVVPLRRSEQMVEAVKAAGGDVKLTIYAELGHNSWSKAYGDPKTYEWLLQQKRQ